LAKSKRIPTEKPNDVTGLKEYDELSSHGRRYRNDPKFRKRAREASKKRNEERRKKKMSEKRVFVDENNVKSAWKPRYYKDVLVYNNTTVARLCNVTRVTMYNWFEAGALPEPTLTDTRGRRWFSWNYVEAIREALQSRLRDPVDRFGEKMKIICERRGIIDKKGKNIETT